MTDDEHVSARSDEGLKMLQYASSRSHTVLDFKSDEDGLTVMDITDHVEHLEEVVNNNDTN